MTERYLNVHSVLGEEGTEIARGVTAAGLENAVEIGEVVETAGVANL